MKTLNILLAAGVLCAPLVAVSAPVMAATAHNSQAGAEGPTTNDDAGVGMNKRARQMKRRAHHTSGM